MQKNPTDRLWKYHTHVIGLLLLQIEFFLIVGYEYFAVRTLEICYCNSISM